MTVHYCDVNWKMQKSQQEESRRAVENKLWGHSYKLAISLQ